MKKNNFVKLLGVALVVAFIATFIYYGMFASKLSSNTGSGRTLVVAAKALKPGTVLALGDLKTVPWATDRLPKGAFEKPEDVAGNTVFVAVGAEEPVMNSSLASAQSGGGSGVPTGMRAVSVHVTDSSGVMALLRGGQKVDVQVVVGRGTKADETEVRTALENLTVLTISPGVEASSQGQQLPVVTLLAKPAEADILAAADSGARVRLSLRNPLDEATRSRSLLTVGTVMRGGADSH